MPVNTNTSTVRRIITGHGPDGKSIVVSDDSVSEGPAGNFDHWMTGRGDAENGVETQTERQPFFPAKGQSFFRFFRIPPTGPDVRISDMEAFAADMFAGFGIAECRIDTSRHPMMHRTPTTDFIVLLSGSVSLLLDEGEPIALSPFDVVVQRATNHAWINTGDSEALLVAVLNGGAIDQD